MMKRRIEKRLIQWQKRENRKPLLLLGARQVGKTYVLQNFGENRFNTSHYFDLEELKADLSPVFTDSSLKPMEMGIIIFLISEYFGLEFKRIFLLIHYTITGIIAGLN